jgi:hypothetical protein
MIDDEVHVGRLRPDRAVNGKVVCCLTQAVN